MNIVEQNTSLAAGTVLKGRSRSYEIVKTLGQGSFGITYLAKTKVQMDGELGSFSSTMYVAIKEFFVKEINGREGTTVTSGSKGGLFGDYRRKFMREATILSKLNHPNIVKVLESFEVNNTCYYVMEYIDGGSLDDMIARQYGLSEAETTKYTLDIASALSFMHSNKMLHLDLKPGNVMINDGHAVLIDFGLSKQYDASGEPESSTTVGGGTPGYAPIEQANHRDGNGFPVTMDVYALGATMFKMLTGERPPIASDILNDGFPSHRFESFNPKLVAVVEKAMAPMRKQRFQTVGELVQDLDKCLTATADTYTGHEHQDEGTVVDGVWNGGSSTKEDVVVVEEDVENSDSSQQSETISTLTGLLQKSNFKLIVVLAIVGLVVLLFLKFCIGGGENVAKINVDTVVVEESVVDDGAKENIIEKDCKQEATVLEQEEFDAKEKVGESKSRRKLTDMPHDVKEKMPSFPGGDAALMNWLSENVRYPAIAQENGVQGRVIVKFIVNINGTISDARVIKSVDPALDKEALRVINSMPNWIPGIKDGEPVAISFSLPVIFSLE